MEEWAEPPVGTPAQSRMGHQYVAGKSSLSMEVKR